MPAPAIRAPLVRVRLGRLGDDRLAALSAAGDERAFEALYDRHHRALLGFCRHMLGAHDEGEDALQQTFLRAHRALLARGAPDDVRPWLFAIARNRCLTLLTARKAAAVPTEVIEPATEGLGAAVERRADLRALLADIERLPEEQRSALVLAQLADLTHAEIATVIGVPAAKVKALVHQARTRLLAEREARDTPCEAVREQLATARGGVLRRGPLRRHLAVCAPCRAYRKAVAEQRAALGLVLPVLPSAGLKEAIFGAISGGGGAAAAGGAATGGAVAGSTLGGAAFSGGGATGLAAKVAVGAALAAGAGGGAVVVKDVTSGPDDRVTPVAATRAPAAAPTAPALGAAAGADANAAAEVATERRPDEVAGRRAGPKRRDTRTGRARAKNERRARAKNERRARAKAERRSGSTRQADRAERAEARAAAKAQRRAARLPGPAAPRRPAPASPPPAQRKRAAVPKAPPQQTRRPATASPTPAASVPTPSHAAPRRQKAKAPRAGEPLP